MRKVATESGQLFFLAGFLTATLFLISAIILILRFLPFTIKFASWNQGTKRFTQTSGGDDGIQDHLLLKKTGWLKMSHSPLSGAQLGWNLDTLDKRSSIVSQSMRIVSQSRDVLRRVFSYENFTTKRQVHSIGDKVPDDTTPTVCFAILDSGILTLYSSKTKTSILHSFILEEFDIELYPEGLNDYEIFWRNTPIKLFSKLSKEHEVYLYSPSAYEKEDWYLLMRRACFSDNDHGQEAMSAYITSMKKLISSISTHLNYKKAEEIKICPDASSDNAITNSTSQKLPESVKEYESDHKDLINIPSQVHFSSEYLPESWLNVLIGRVFVAIHSSPRIKNYIIQKLKRESYLESSSFLSCIQVQDIHVGDSAPVFSNMKLIHVSIHGELQVEMNIDYNGGLRVKAATHTTVSVPSLNQYVSPLEIPIVVSIKVVHFSAKVLLKIKPFWESSRIWFGFYPDPSLKLEVIPIISDRLVQFEIVNQIIEERVKEALSEFAVLPNMDDLAFWKGDGAGGIFDEDLIDDSISCTESLLDSSDECIETQDDLSIRGADDNVSLCSVIDHGVVPDDNSRIKYENIVEDFINSKASETTEYVQSDYFEQEQTNTFSSTPIRIDEEAVSEPMSKFSVTPTKTPSHDSVMNSYLSKTIAMLHTSTNQYKLDEKFKSAMKTAQEYGLDDTAKSIVDTASAVGSGVMEFMYGGKNTTPKATNTGSGNTVFEYFGVNVAASAPVSPMKVDSFSRRSTRNSVSDRTRRSVSGNEIVVPRSSSVSLSRANSVVKNSLYSDTLPIESEHKTSCKNESIERERDTVTPRVQVKPSPILNAPGGIISTVVDIARIFSRK